MVKVSLDLVSIHAHFSTFIDHGHPSTTEEIKWLMHHVSNLIIHFISDLNLSSVIELSWIWLNSFALEIACKLLRDLSKDLLGKSDWVSLKITIWYKLYYISVSILSQFLGVKWCNVTIQLLHLIEVCVSNTYDNVTQWERRALYDLFYSVLEICDTTICDK